VLKRLFLWLFKGHVYWAEDVTSLAENSNQFSYLTTN